MLTRFLWNISFIAWIVFYAALGVVGAHHLDWMKVGVAGIGLLCLAIAMDVRAMRGRLNESKH